MKNLILIALLLSPLSIHEVADIRDKHKLVLVKVAGIYYGVVVDKDQLEATLDNIIPLMRMVEEENKRKDLRRNSKILLNN